MSAITAQSLRILKATDVNGGSPFTRTIHARALPMYLYSHTVKRAESESEAHSEVRAALRTAERRRIAR
jgi:hypothetical protein